MLRLSQKQCAALEAVVHIASQAGGDPVSGKVLSKTIEQPSRYLEPMLQQLVRTGILRGIRGPKGGYVLAKERRRITVREICEALNDDVSMQPKRLSKLGDLLIAPLCKSALNAAYQAMDGIALADLCEQSQHLKKTTPTGGAKPDFTI